MSRPPGKLPSPDERGPLLEALRRRKMARSVHAYVRGSTVKFYEWLASSRAAAAPDGPPVWICGDCHLGNLGPVANGDGEVEVEIRDLDQTVIGNPAHDLIRLALSLATAARSSDLPGVTTARMIEEMVASYRRVLGKSNVAAVAPPDAVRRAMGRALSRRWRHLAEERIQDRRPTIPLGRKLWPLSDAERSDLTALFAESAVRELVSDLRGRGEPDSVALIDAAYWVKGCSSLGQLRYAALVRVDKAGGEGARYGLIDVKEAAQAAAPRAADAAMPRDNGERVVEGARNLSPYLGRRMLPARLVGRAVVLREVLPQDLKLELDRMDSSEAVAAARYLAAVVGQAHARQMTSDVRAAWRRALDRRRMKTLDAPSWLWTSVVDLLAIHEAAYLEHCRKYAMDTAAV